MKPPDLEQKINPYESPRSFDNPHLERRLNILSYFCLAPIVFPTLVRKYAPESYQEKLSKSMAKGMFLGFSFYSGISGFLLLFYDSDKTSYAFIPALIPLATNLISGCYELLRQRKN